MIEDGSKEKHPLQIWTSLRPGDTVAITGPDRQKYQGTVETGTEDGLVIWIRTNLNERKMFHFHHVNTVQIIDNP